MNDEKRQGPLGADLEEVWTWACCGEPASRVRAEHLADVLRSERDKVTRHARNIYESLKGLVRFRTRVNGHLDQIRSIFREELFEEKYQEMSLDDDQIARTICESLRELGRLKRQRAEESHLPVTGYIGVPVAAAEEIAKKYGKHQVLIVCFEHGGTHVTSFGKTETDAEEAALGGKTVKRVLDWTDDHSLAKSETA